MPVIGEITKGRELGYANRSGNWVWVICTNCGKERWVRYVNDRPIYDTCVSCHRTMPRIKITKQELEQAYIQRQMSTTEIAKTLSCARSSITRLLKINGIPSRSISEGLKTAFRLGKASNKGERNPRWREDGRRELKPGGYIAVRRPEHPRAQQGWVPEHIVIWEEVHGQSLPKGWIVHHLNGNKQGNHPSNLLALPKKGHSPALTVKEVQKRLREVEVENRQLYHALEVNRAIFYFSEN